jgi:hypothetical protein
MRPRPASPEPPWVAGPRHSAVGAGVGRSGHLLQRIGGGRSGPVPRPGKRRPTAGVPGASSRLRSSPVSVFPAPVPIARACRGRPPAFGCSSLAISFPQRPCAQHCLAADARLRSASHEQLSMNLNLQRAPRRAPLKASLCARGQASPKGQGSRAAEYLRVGAGQGTLRQRGHRFVGRSSAARRGAFNDLCANPRRHCFVELACRSFASAVRRPGLPRASAGVLGVVPRRGVRFSSTHNISLQRTRAGSLLRMSSNT